MTVKRFLLTCLAVGSLTLAYQPAQAQGLLDSLLDSAKEALEQDAGSGTGVTAGLAENEIIQGLKQALEIGTGNVVSQVSAQNGYGGDPTIRIPLPSELVTVHQTLSRVGLGSIGDSLEGRLNQAAEQAAPEARAIFVDALQQMTIEDARGILNGPETSATDYFRRTTSDALGARIRPIVEQSLADVGALSLYDQFMGQYTNLPFVPDVRSDVIGHTTDLAVQGIFHYVAQEEVAIRQDPAKRTTELLQRVFSN